MTQSTTYSPAYGAIPGMAAAPKQKGLFLRFIDRLVEARMRRAEEYIRHHSHLIPRELQEQADWRLTERSEDSLPFIR